MSEQQGPAPTTWKRLSGRAVWVLVVDGRAVAEVWPVEPGTNTSQAPHYFRLTDDSEQGQARTRHGAQRLARLALWRQQMTGGKG
jgi:hypothetical protein